MEFKGTLYKNDTGVSSTAAVTIKVDPTVTLATKKDILTLQTK